MNLLDTIRKSNGELTDYKPTDVDIEWNNFKKKANILPIGLSIKKENKIFSLSNPLAKAAAIFICVLAIYLITKPGAKVNSLKTLAQSEIIHMIDGSTINLDPYSSVSYPTDLNKATERKIDLKGRASFAVSHDPSLPFVVHCGDILVKALGTEFSVKESDTAILVIDLSGSVEVTDRFNNNKAAILLPGDKLWYKKGLFYLVKARKDTLVSPISAYHTEVVSEANSEQSLSVKSGFPQGIHTYLTSDVLKELSRRYPGKIKFSRKIRTDKKQTLNLDLSKQKEYILQIISQNGKYKVVPGKCKDCVEIEIK